MLNPHNEKRPEKGNRYPSQLIFTYKTFLYLCFRVNPMCVITSYTADKVNLAEKQIFPL